MAAPVDVDWLSLCRRAGVRARAVIAERPSQSERARTAGRGAGGDLTLVIDRAVEDCVFDELEGLEIPMTVVSEERGEVGLLGGSELRVIVDPIDGSRNAARGIPSFCLSLAVAEGATMHDVTFGYVHNLARGEDWWALRGGGAFHAGRPLRIPRRDSLELVGLETASAELIREHADALARTGADRLRAIGSIALSLCQVAGGRFDGMVSLGPTRSVDAAAGQLIVREAGGAVCFSDADRPLSADLSLGMRSRVAAAADDELLARLLPVGAPGG